jgi:hypothetical protein
VSESPTLLYLEADDEITAVVRRIRSAEPGRVVVVAPGRSRATSSAVALRLLARAAEGDGREIAIVGDALTRSLAAEAGIAAFATVDEARRGDTPAVPGAATPSHATIHVVRGPATEDAPPTLAAAAAAGTGAVDIGSDDMTRPVPVARHPGRAPQARRAERARRVAGTAAIAAVVLLVVAAVAAGALLLPAASVAIRPATAPVGPVEYSVTMTDPLRETGTAEATATVRATGTYETLEPASGTVVLFNWTFGPVFVPAGTFVAAGEQAFATQADVTVPRGRLTLFGTIQAGDIEVGVEAAAPGPDGNVEAQAINIIVNESVDAQLRGFPENPEPRVVNPQPTSGGLDESGPEITEADVAAATSALREQLTAQAPASDDETIVVVTYPDEATITGTEGLAGTREAEAEIAGTLEWEALSVDRSTTAEAAVDQLPSEVTDEIPAGSEVLGGSEAVQFVNARAIGDAVEVDVRVSASSIAVVDADEVADRIAGMTADDAELELADIGEATVELWPGWVSTVPSVPGRVDVVVGEPLPDESAAGTP